MKSSALRSNFQPSRSVRSPSRRKGLRQAAALWRGHIRAAGAATLSVIANELNSREMMTPRGGRWHASSVANLLRRLDTWPGRSNSGDREESQHAS